MSSGSSSLACRITPRAATDASIGRPTVSRGIVAGCLNLVQRLSPRVRIVLALLLGVVALDPVRAACAGDPLRIEPLAPDVWWVPGAATGDADAGNRGQVSNLLLVRQGPRLWALGSGPSPVFGARLACEVRARLGLALSDVIAPWPRPELVLGQSGMPGVRRWAHADVAQAMAQRCADCVGRLRQRLGEAAVDLGDQPVTLPEHRFRGAQGTLGPFRWWRLERMPGVPVTVWQLRRQPALVAAQGLLWGHGAPDGRDADPEALAATMAALRVQFPRGSLPGPARRWMGEQGPLLDEAGVDAHARYWPALQAAAEAAVARGDDETAPAPELPGLAALSQGLLHGLNWQRAWRQSEERSFQRSRR